jgi:hypothetical protein
MLALLLLLLLTGEMLCSSRCCSKLLRSSSSSIMKSKGRTGSVVQAQVSTRNHVSAKLLVKLLPMLGGE